MNKASEIKEAIFKDRPFAPERQRGPAVLVVDDEKSIRISVRAFLQADGFHVQVAENADEAQNLLDTNEFDVVITDIMMPGATGVELLAMIQTKAPDVPVVLMTGDPSVQTAVDAMRAGATDYLTKPIRREEILRTIRHAAELKLFRDQNKALEEQNRDYRENLERMVEERTAALNQIVEGAILAMSKAVESRDPYTAGHEQNVANLAREIAKKMNLSEDQIDGVYYGGVVHDIGKISVPAEILSFPGKLEPEQMALIRMHPKTAFQILNTIEFPWPLAQIVYQHHERIDGSGYPQGLKDDEILLEAKILAVADVVESMYSHRPYRPALGIEPALDEITKNRGKIYDPNVVDACKSLIAEGYDIGDRHNH